MIDFHTHIFPDPIAEKTVAYLGALAELTPHGDGTARSLLADMRTSGVTLSLNLPVVTDPRQTASINRFASEINARGGGLASFGGIHPNDPDPEETLDTIRALGLRGVKLHPDYQGVMIDDARFLCIIRGALARGLHVVSHAGVDIGFPDKVHCPPDRAAAMLDAVRGHAADGARVILAHLGGCDMYREVEEHLLGRGDVLFDLAFVLRRAEPETVLRIIRRHGAENILFGSDFPWSCPSADIARLRSLGLCADECDAILEGNARSLLA